MCGIVGLFLKNKSLEPRLGSMLAGMLAVMSDRGPDSAGFAVYGAGDGDHVKLTLRSGDSVTDRQRTSTVTRLEFGNDCMPSLYARTKSFFVAFSAVLGSIQELREIVAAAQKSVARNGIDIGIVEHLVFHQHARTMTAPRRVRR